ncbi:MAG: hypothetical protein EA369_03015 [Bradymonadales bacterium]|nr:MAG: hypothetical protein EA369_03015 [Bradymonadales bacterium]
MRSWYFILACLLVLLVDRECQARTFLPGCSGSLSALLNSHEQTYHPVIRVTRTAKRLTDRDVENSLGVIYAINDFFKGLLPLPPKLNLTLRYTSYKTFYVHSERRLEIPRRRVLRGQTSSREETYIILAHEYGHAIFSHLLDLNFPELGEKIQNLKTEIDRQTGLEASLIQELRALKADDPRRPDLLNELKSLNSRSLQLEWLKLADFGWGFGELAADLIGVVYAGFGEAIAEVIHEPGDARFRDFTVEHSVEGFDRNQEHERFAPTRFWLWENVLNRDDFALKGPNKVKVILEALIVEMKERYQNGEMSLSPAESNRRLIRLIENVL